MTYQECSEPSSEITEFILKLKILWTTQQHSTFFKSNNEGQNSTSCLVIEG